MKTFLRFVWDYFRRSPWYMWVLRIGLAFLLLKLYLLSQKIGGPGR